MKDVFDRHAGKLLLGSCVLVLAGLLSGHALIVIAGVLPGFLFSFLFVRGLRRSERERAVRRVEEIREGFRRHADHQTAEIPFIEERVRRETKGDE